MREEYCEKCKKVVEVVTTEELNGDCIGDYWMIKYFCENCNTELFPMNIIDVS